MYLHTNANCNYYVYNIKVLQKRKNESKKSQVTGVYSHLAAAPFGETVAVSLHKLLGETIIPPLHQHLAARVRIRGGRVQLAARSGAAYRHAVAALRAVRAHDCSRGHR